MNYVSRSRYGITVNLQNGVEKHYHKGLIEFLNECTLEGLSTYEGRIKSVGKVLNINSKVPVFIDKELLLFPTKGTRNYDCYFINYHQVLSISKWPSNQTKVVFNDLTTIILDIDNKKINKQMERCVKIVSYLSIKRKCLH